MALQREWKTDLFQARLEAPDLLVARYEGDVSLAGARQIVEMYQEASAERPLFVINDISRSTIGPEARDVLAKECRIEWFQAVIYVGAGMVQRAMTKAMSLAIYFMGKSAIDFHFADTEAQARALVETLRAKSRPVARGA